MTDLAARLSAGFAAAFDGSPDGVVRAPGRVNIIGEHTDYNDGFVLPCAIPVETRIAWRARPDTTIRVVAIEFANEQDEFDVAQPIEHAPDGGWRDYVRAMIATLVKEGRTLRGADLAIVGDIPRGAGLSSSASLEVAVGHAMLAVLGETPDATRIAVQAQTAENDFVGMKCGVMDQLASAASVADAALLIDCRSLETRAIPIPAGTAIVIIHSGVVRGLVEGHYNRRRAECEEAARILGVPKLRDATLEMIAAAGLTGDVLARARHVVTEDDRVIAAVEALASDDLRTMGRLMADSHASMRDDFQVTVPKVDELAATAHDLIATLCDGQGGARMTGGGFGGAVVALMPENGVEAVTAGIRERYRTPAGDAPEIMVARAVAGAGKVD